MRRALLLLLLALPVSALPIRAQTTAFGQLVARLSEPGGSFGSDNLVSNETSYLHALDGFRAVGVRGGAYLGVGPEQGFSYIAELQPELAIMIDIRRDNLVLHLLLKAMFAMARNRMEYLCLLYGRPLPPDLPLWTDLDLTSLIEWLDTTLPDSALHDRRHRELMRRVAGYGVPLDDQDRATVRRFHDEFVRDGLDVRYSSRGRGPRFFFPTARDLYLETDRAGTMGSYLATEDRWRVVRDLQQRDRVIPVVGDLSGPGAVRAIGDYLRERNLVVSAFYLSNVESYLFRYGTFPAFAENVRTLPHDPNSVLVRSWFGRGALVPASVPGHFSAQVVQTFTDFLAMTARPDTVSYWNLVSQPLPPLP